MKLSVLLPAFNEEATLAEVIRRVAALPVDLEILAVDDASTDGTRELLDGIDQPGLRVFGHERNRGKGAAIRTALPHARGEYVVIQDGDLEYDPADLLRLLRVAEEEGAAVVYGNRVHGRFQKSYHRYYLGGRLVTLVTNLLYGTSIHDEPVCYKLFRREVLQGLPLRCKGFEFCPEVTALAVLAGHRIREVPVSYRPRGFQDGKKISWRDGIQAILTLVRLRLTGRRRLAR